MPNNDIGLIGLAVMGQNLVLNMESRGFSVAVYNRSSDKTRAFVEGPASGKRIEAAYELTDFVASLKRPRAVMIMVKAGAAVDAVIEQLLSLLSEGDLILDNGNSLFSDTARRATALEAKGIGFLGVGVSGGEEGARHGPSIMPGGSRELYGVVQPVLEAIAAQVDGEPCVTYIGPGGAGHFVKMVHNGIEYGDMQLIAEAYDLMHRGAGLSAAELAEVFAAWNDGPLASYLIEISAQVFRKLDEKTGKPLVDLILDQAGQKGTGRWTVQAASDLGVPVPTINAAVEARGLSAFKQQRVRAAGVLSGSQVDFTGDKAELVALVGDALYASKVASYAQGFAMLAEASSKHGWDLNLGAIARIWRGGCIIRADFLDDIKQAFDDESGLPNLLLAPFFAEGLAKRQQTWRTALQAAIELGVPVPAMSASLAYYDAYRSERLPANLIQAQRDLFGAHTFRRIDEEGTFHVDWS